MKSKSFGFSLAMLALSSLLLPLSIASVAALPLGRHPDMPNWPGGTPWGAKLRYENASTGYVDEDFFGPGREDSIFDNSGWLASLPEGWIGVALLGNDSLLYSKICVDNQSPPQRYTWTVALMSGGTAPVAGGTLWCDWENGTNWFVPQDYYIVLENSATFGHFNMRAENRNLPAGTAASPNYAALHVDNAVNVTISPSSNTGSFGDNVSFTVAVNNTGRYDDTYSLGVDAGDLSSTISHSSLSINAGSSATATLTVTIGIGTKVITVTADGAYADDEASCTATPTAEGQYVLTTNVSPSNSGSVTLNPASETYPNGTVVTATAAPASGYEFDHWSGDASGTSTSVTVTMNSAKSITANFRSTGEGKERGGLPWTWIGLGIVIIVIIIVVVVAATRRVKS
jgi:hypothetical protein